MINVQIVAVSGEHQEVPKIRRALKNFKSLAVVLANVCFSTSLQVALFMSSFGSKYAYLFVILSHIALDIACAIVCVILAWDFVNLNEGSKHFSSKVSPSQATSISTLRPS